MASNSNCGALTTRSMTNIWLIGQLQSELPVNVLPTTDKVMDMWNKARIPTTYHTHVVEKVNEAQRAREKEFEEKEHMLFDIAHQHAMQLIRIQEDIEFLEDQRGSRRMQMSGIDKDLTKKEERTEQRKCKKEERKEREQERMTESTSLHLSSSDDSDSEQQDTEDNYEIEIPVYYKKQISEDRDRNPLLVHWDGKIMNDDPHSRTDRLAVVVTGCNVEKILGIVKIASSTGQAQANATFQLLKLWDVSEDIIGMCFDTTAANTGTSSGACVLLEKLLHRNLLHFACRHHVHELIIGEVFTVLFGPSRGPNIGMFERFRAYWPNINQSNHKPLDDDRMNYSLLQMMRSDIDYKELVELCLLVLGYPMQTDGKYHFRVPGAYHMARWMAKVIYCLKMYLFRYEFKLTATETKSLTEFCLFATHIYVPAWMLCPIPSDAPVNDLQLLSRIEQYSKINKNVASAGTKKLKNHLWYLGTEMVWLSLFSNKVANAEKQLIVEAMTAVDSDWSVRGVKYPATELEHVKSKPLHDLVSGTSRAALLSLGMDAAILRETELEHVKSKPLHDLVSVANVVKSLKVVNDTAERTVALMTNFNQSITKNETELQKLIQVVEDNRTRIPDSSKRTLASAQAAAAMF
ncbi:hypothetical protein HELRODRAFT_171303 [Helobdella robusta]|uniref:Uncharacterized protein n=1 Tax=Helobdella robusta TaxID=6412 RepID=T1F424_HELRO|nr:hypothetical protein HELRODRAFT_171303 [Helobdella robusta]ESO05645.1 hypothetical protein HELRODRAFT_171303 [Helobdella robusta]